MKTDSQNSRHFNYIPHKHKLEESHLGKIAPLQIKIDVLMMTMHI